MSAALSMNREEKLARLDKFTELAKYSGGIRGRNENPPELSEEDDVLLTRIWKELAKELEEEQEHNNK